MLLTFPSGPEPLRSRVPASSLPPTHPHPPCCRVNHAGITVPVRVSRATSSFTCAALRCTRYRRGWDTEEGGGQPFHCYDLCGNLTDVDDKQEKAGGDWCVHLRQQQDQQRLETKGKAGGK
ncbi:hypothetical protein PAL_GLEAN10008114 [Pteropus alecto]|uniref:Uncharacterized protein n=1 Tax=Pteropus alecto TaxID=9402 RepID=L5K0G7_PTEAL|nr:hypothetical protein PAL_GLEAN10008114 [Pteropus alecto]